MVKINDITDPDSRNALMRLIEIGVTPLQIYATDSKPKFDKKQFLEKSPIYLNAKGNFIYEKKDLAIKIIKLNNFKNIKKKLYENDKCSKNKIYSLDKDDFTNIKIIKMKQIENNNIRVYTSTNHWFNIKIYPNYKDLSPIEPVLKYDKQEIKRLTKIDLKYFTKKNKKNSNMTPRKTFFGTSSILSNINN